MKALKKNKDHWSDQIALKLAQKLQSCQSKWAGWMDRKFNTMTAGKRKILFTALALVAFAWSASLLLGLSLPGLKTGRPLPGKTNNTSSTLASDSLRAMESIYKHKK